MLLEACESEVVPGHDLHEAKLTRCSSESGRLAGARANGGDGLPASLQHLHLEADSNGKVGPRKREKSTH